MTDRAHETPAASVVVLAYNSRPRIHWALDSLQRQDFDAPHEVIVVDSGSDDCASYVRSAYPSVRVIQSERRLYPGAARNAGIRAARGRYVAFLADDCVAQPDWLRRRVERHRQGFEAVGGAVTNGTPGHPVGTAGYLLEYLHVIPAQVVLERQPVPHSLSYSRQIFDRHGHFREDVLTGEDTLFGALLLTAGEAVCVDERVRMAHKNPTRISAFLRHQYDHGRGLARHRAQRSPGIWSPSLPPHLEPLRTAVRRMVIEYPVARWWSGLRLVAHDARRWLPGYVALSPLIWAGLVANVSGQWLEWRAARVSGRAGAGTPAGAGPPADPTSSP